MQDTLPPQRSIRSFVRRTGRLTPSQKKALEEQWPVFGIDIGTNPLSLDELFGRKAPIVLEIGFGNGETLVQQAGENPDKNYLGIEVHEPGVGHCLLRARDSGTNNLRLVIHDAIEILTEQISAATLSRVNLYFPDPWPKKRHNKRRIVQPAFLELVAAALVDCGTLNIATDWAAYAEHIDELVERSDQFTCTQRQEHSGEQPLDRPRTKFERRGLKKGHRIFDWCLMKSRIS